MMFARLAALRATLREIPAFSVDAPTRAAIVAGIDALDDAMVEETRAFYAEHPFHLYQLAAHGATGGDIQ